MTFIGIVIGILFLILVAAVAFAIWEITKVFDDIDENMS